MLVVLGFSHKDRELACNLLEWTQQLDGFLPTHEVVLVASSQVDDYLVKPMVDLAGKAFGTASAVRQKSVNEGPWPIASNWLFDLAVKYLKARGNNRPWLWLEPDCVPTVRGWLDMIQNEYNSKRKPFLGTIYPHPEPHLNGVMVYPPRIESYNAAMLAGGSKPWDLQRPKQTLRHGADTPLIQRYLQKPQENLPKTFYGPEDLEVIRDGVVLFHGCKDGSLIEVLRGRNKLRVISPEHKELIEAQRERLMVRKPPLTVAFPFCEKDLPNAQLWMLWARELGGCPGHECVLVHSHSMRPDKFEDIERKANEVFDKVSVMRALRPLADERYPKGPNLMFETMVKFAEENLSAPWFWCEPDCIPLKREWLDALQEEYYEAGKLFMGSIVPGKQFAYPQHLTGCAVYPPHATDYVENGFGSSFAWDIACANTVLPEAHHTKLFHHEWPHSGGISTWTEKDLARIPEYCVVCHQSKDGSLANLLRARMEAQPATSKPKPSKKVSAAKPQKTMKPSVSCS